MEIKQISASRIKTFDHCQFKYVLNYMLYQCHSCHETFYTPEMGGALCCPYCQHTEFSRPELKTNWGAVHGSALHEVMENYATAIRGADEKGNKLDNALINQYLNWRDAVHNAYKRNENGKAIWDIAKVKDTENTKKWCKACQNKNNSLCEITGEVMTNKNCPKALYLESLELVQKYIDRYTPIFKNRKILGIEKAFSVDTGQVDDIGQKIIFNGFMDLVTEIDKETIEIIDYKFGSWVPSFEEFNEDIQVKLYSLAARKTFPEYKEIIITFDYIRKNPLSTGFDIDDDNKTLEFIIQKWKQIQQPQKVKRTIIDGDCVNPDSSWKCKTMCDNKLCNVEWVKFKEKFNA